ncbi:hypothetical protein P9E09_07045 [Bacillus mojavensis]|uniref:hypothetical protein n=1 Tax=Bacillus mojavensis TaxID=72360 RepID=UPI002DB5D00F|nr:hypothetical protein [Bacillus mojavensis]MEC1707409.1 hypothetical protein [Bacillus mojavensis]
MDKAMEYIDKLAAKLGVAAEHVYGVLVKQAIANGITNVVVGVILLIAFVLTVRFMIAILTKAEYEEVTHYYGDSKTPVNKYAKISSAGGGSVWVLIIAFILISSVAGLVCLTEGFKALINPEYYAIKEILDTVKGE